MPSFDFASLYAEKANTVQNASETKKANISNAFAATEYFRNRMEQEHQALAPMASLQDDSAFQVHIDPIKESLIDATTRGGSEAIQGMIGLAYGVGAGAGAVAESILGEGGLSTGFKKAMVQKYVENEQDMAQYTRPEDSLTYSWEKAKDGDYGAMLSWMTHGTGYVAAQLATMLTGAGVIAGGTRVLGKKAVSQLAGSLIEREAGRIAAVAGEKVVTDAILKEATKTVATRIGGHLGMAAGGFGMEGGEIMGDLAKQSVIEDRTLTGAEIGKGLTATALAGAVEYTESLLGLKALKGKLGSFPGVNTIEGIGGKLARGAVTGVKTAAAEAVQEATQTGIERWGKGQEVLSEEGKQEIIDAAGLGALGGGPASIGGLATRSIKEQEAIDKAREEKQRIKPQITPDFKKKVSEAAKTEEGVKKYSDPNSPDFNETTAIHVVHNRITKEEVSSFSKIETGNDAIKLFQDMYKERADLFNQIKTATDEEVQADPEKYTEMENKVKELNVRIKDTTPFIQAIAKATERDDAEALDNFRAAFIKDDGTTSGNVSRTLRNLFGSAGSHSFFDPTSDDYVDIEAQLQNNQGRIQENELSELTAASELQKATGVILKQVDKTAGRVNTDILEGSPEGDFKGISQHINDIVVSLDAGDINQAKNSQNRLSTWAKKRADRAATFEGMYEAYKNNVDPAPEIQKAFDRINNDRLAQGYKEPYYINDKTEGLVQFMKLEADALQKAVAYSESMFENRPTKASTVKSVKQQSTKQTVPSSVQEMFREESDKKTITLYRGENEKNTKGGEWWTTNKAKAAKYGHVIEETISISDMKHAAQGHGGIDEFVFPTEGNRPPDLAKNLNAVNTKNVTIENTQESQKNPPGKLDQEAAAKNKIIFNDKTDKTSTKEGIVKNQELSEVKTLNLNDAVIAFNAESQKPLKFRNTAWLKSLRDHIQDLKKESPKEPSNVKQEIKRTKDEPVVTISDKAIKLLKKDFLYRGYNKSEVDTIEIVSTEKNEQSKDLQAIGKAFGVRVFLFDSKVPEINQNYGKAIFTEDNFVFINQNAPMSYAGILGHEITHQLEYKHPDLYQKLDQYFEVSSEEFDKFKSNLVAGIENKVDRERYLVRAKAELNAMFVGEHFANKSFWKKVYVSDKELFHTLIGIVNRVLEKAMQSLPRVSQYFKDVKMARKVLFEVMQEAIQREKAVDTSIEKTPETTLNKVEPKEIIIKHPEISLRGLQKTEVSSKGDPLIKSIETFHNSFNNTLNYILNVTKDDRFIDKDPIQYLIQEDGSLPADIIEALSATAYKWLATQASSYVVNDDRAIRKILGMDNDKDTPITQDAQKVLRYIGVQANYITEALGKEAVKLAGIKIGDQAPYDLKERMELSFGSMIIAILEYQKLIESTFVNGGQLGYNPSGFSGLKAKQEDIQNPIYTNVTKDFFIPKTSIDGKKTNLKDTSKIVFYKPVSIKENGKYTVTSKIKTISKLWRNNKDSWDQIYGLGKNNRDYSWTPFTYKEDFQAKAKRSGALLTKEQTSNLIKNSNIPWVANAPVMNVFLALGSKDRNKILGYKDQDTEHISEVETNKGINLGIDRSIDRLYDWLEDAEQQENSYASEFYIPAEFWLQERMGMVGSISPQGDKLMRAMFNMKDWTYDIDLNNTQDYNLFMLGVGLYLDVEFTKEGGLEKAVKKTEEKLNTPVMQEGIKAIRALIKRANDINNVTPGELDATSEEVNAIINAVEAGEVKAESLKSLVEYTRYLMAKDSGAKKFATTMTIEIDGTANGPAFGRWQFMTDPENALLHLAALQTSGYRFHENIDWDLSEHLSGDLNHDAYQITGFAWAKRLLKKENWWLDRSVNDKLTSTKRNFASKTIDKMRVFQEIMGDPISATGNVSKEMRKLSKPPTMKTMYSMGETKLTQELINATINTIYQQLKKAALNEDTEALHKLNLATHTLTDTWLLDVTKENGEWVTLPVDTQTILKKQLSTEAINTLSDHIKYNQGKEMYEAVKEVFTEIKESTQILNKGIGLATVFYNTLREGYLNQAVSLVAKNQNIPKEEVILTTADIKKIDKRLENLFPQIQGAGGSFLPMAQMDISRDYAGKHPVVQGYRQKDKNGRKINPPTRKTVYPHQIKQLADPGVSGTVKSIQHLDAAVANKLMAHYSFLNNHDGFTVGIKDAVALSQKANELFTKVNSNYSVSESVDKLLQNSNKIFYQRAEELQKEFPEFDFLNVLHNQLLKTKLGQKYDPRLKKYIPISIEEAVPTAFEIKDEVHTIATENKAQRDILKQALQGIQQYAFPGGEYKTGNKLSDQLYGITPSDITTARTVSLKKDILEMQQLKKDLGYVIEVTPGEAVKIITEKIEEPLAKTLSGSQYADMSLDPSDYELETAINEETVVDIYDAIKNDGTKKDSATHNSYLKNILTSIVQGVIQPLDLFTKTDSEKDTTGKFDADNSRIFISSHSGLLNQGINMSTGEVYVHELVHAVIHQALDTDKRLRSKVSRLYDVVFKEMQRRYQGEEFRVFLNDPSIDITDPANQAEIELAKSRYDYFFRTPDKRGGKEKNAYTGVMTDKTVSNHLDEFMAYALTNENFGNFLKEIELKDTGYVNSTWEGLRGKNIQETLLNLFQAIIDFFRGRFTDVNKKTALAEAEALAFKLSRIQSNYKTKKFETLRKVSGFNNKLYEMGNGVIKQAFHKALPKAANWKKGYEMIIADPSKAGEMFREMYNYIEAMDQGIIKTTVQEIRGMTPRLSDYYQLLTRRKRMLDAVKEEASHTYSTIANEFFKKELTAPEKVTLTKAGLRTDVIILLDSIGSDKLLKVYQDDAIRQAEIKKILDELSDVTKFPETAQYTNYYDRAAMALGDFIVHSQFRQGEDAGLNAQLISELSGTTHTGKLKTDASLKVEPLIDQLASLYAIDSLPVMQRNKFAEIMAEDPEGVYKTLQLHKTLKLNANKALFAGSKRLFIKGYTKTILNPEIDLKYGVLAEESEMKKIGYTRSLKPLPRDPADPYKNQDIYVYTARIGRLNNLASGILSYTRNKAKGTSSKVVAEQFDPMTAAGLRTTKTILQFKQDIRNRMFTEKRNPHAKLANSMIAKVDRSGNIIDYRYMMSEATKDAYLDQVNDFDIVLGAMAGQIVDKHVTPVINEELVKRLKQTYDEEFFNNPAAFVKIGPNADDPSMVEQYYMIPEKTQKVIAKIWGPTKTMYVPKDLMTLAFGYRKYSAVDAFIKKPAERTKVEQMIVALTNKIVRDSTGETGKGIRAINTVEQLATELTHYAKDNIIVKSLTVTLGNFGSNLIYLRMRGVPTATILKLGLEAIKYGIQYQADIMKANKLGIEKIQIERENTSEAKQRLKIIENKLMQLQDALNRNPVADSIDSGLMPSLIDDVDTQGQKNYFPGQIEKFVDDKTKRVPKPLKTAGKVLFLSQDTEAYKVLNNGVKLTDFVGRHVLYNYYTKSQGMDQKEAAQKAIEEFINFDIASHRITEYLNEIGLLWFTKYATRIPMVAVKAIADKPFDSFMSYLMSTHIGFDNIVDSVVPNISYKIDTPPTAWVGSVDELVTSQLIGSILP